MKQKILCSLLTATLVTASPILPAFAAQLVHGPLYLPDEHEGQLAFYQTGKQIEAHMGDMQGRKIASYDAKSKVVAVFYQDLDGDGQDEILVMLQTPAGNALHSYGWRSGYWQTIPRIQPQLDKLTAQAKSFTVAALRKQLKQLPQQQYLIRYDDSGINDPNIQKLLQGKLDQDAKFSGYQQEDGKLTSSPSDASDYSLRYPLWLGSAHKYQLIAHFTREDYVSNGSQSGFMMDWVGYAASDGSRSGPSFSYALGSPDFAAIITTAHYQNNQLDGEYQIISPQRGKIIESGRYRAGKRQGHWQEANDDISYWLGDYENDQKVGKWQLINVEQPNHPLGFANYHKGLLDGAYERSQLNYRDTQTFEKTGQHTTRVVAKGHYQRGKKGGDWLEYENGHTLKLHYEQGLKSGLQQTFDAQNILIAEENFKAGEQSGVSRYYFDNGALKSIQPYLHGQLDGVRYDYFNGDDTHRQLHVIRHYKAYRSGKKWFTKKEGASIRFNQDGSLYKVENFSNDYTDGPQLEFNRKGQLREIQTWQLSPSKIGAQLEGQSVWFFQKTGKVRDIRDFKNGELAGDSYSFHLNDSLKERRHYCDPDQDKGCKPGHIIGQNNSFYENGMKHCEKQFDNTALVSFACYDQLGRRTKAQDVMLDGNIAKRRYIDGQLFHDSYWIATASKTVNGQQVPNYAHLKRDGIMTVYFPRTKLPRFKILYQKGERVCAKEFSRDGKQTEKTKSCQF